MKEKQKVINEKNWRKASSLFKAGSWFIVRPCCLTEFVKSELKTIILKAAELKATYVTKSLVSQRNQLEEGSELCAIIWTKIRQPRNVYLKFADKLKVVKIVRNIAWINIKSFGWNISVVHFLTSISYWLYKWLASKNTGTKRD